MKMRIKNILIIACFLTFFSSVVSAENPANPKVRLQTNMGDIVLELYMDKAPITVENFLGYVNDGYYAGTIFHRVMDGFMIQGGGFTAEMQKKGTRAPIKNEADNGLRNDRGTIAMARTNVPHSATSQFFINVVDNQFLNYRSKTGNGWGYAVFGKVIQGMDVVDKIKAVKTQKISRAHTHVPVQPVIIKEASVLRPAGE